ncbi:MAG: hypothetical protein WC602_00465 [archaeon]
MSFLKNWRFILLIAALVIGTAIIAFNGMHFGIDFRGGTLFTIQLSQKVSSQSQLQNIEMIIQQRLDYTGLKDTKVSGFGDEFIIAQVAETNPVQIAKMESLLRKQGRFESVLDGNVVFTGADFIQITKDTQKGYGFFKQGDFYEWRLPFTLKHEAASRFAQAAFHKCVRTGFDAQARTSQYECDKTYFFIDRPIDAVLIYPKPLYDTDKDLYLQGSIAENIPAATKIDDVLNSIMTPNFVYDQNLSAEQIASLSGLAKTNPNAMVPSTIDSETRAKLVGMGFTVKEVQFRNGVPWSWDTAGLRQIISLSEDIANMDKANVSEVKVFSDLYIRGGATSTTDAMEKLTSLSVLLESGSLPIPVQSISKETISPSLGKEFFKIALIMGLLAIVAVAIVIFLRYRHVSLSASIMAMTLCEAYLVLAFASLIKWNLDIAAVAGIIAAVGTGVDDQIIITDELLKKSYADSHVSLTSRVKRAFFLVLSTAAVTIATMLPIVILGGGMSKLVGFAITTIAGVLIGITITRPAYGEIAKFLLAKEEARKAAKAQERN